MSSLLEKEFIKLYDDWKTKQDATSRLAIVTALSPIIQKSIIAAGGDAESSVVKAKAKLLALDGLRKYNPEKAALKPYMYSHMRGMHRVLGSSNNIIQTPESVVLDNKRLNATEQRLLDELGRYPSTRELADASGLSLKRIAKLRKSNLPVTEHQIDTVFGESGAPAVSIMGDNKKEEAWLEYVYDTLSDRQKCVMEQLYGMHGYKAKSANRVAKDLGISAAAVSQHRKTIDKLLNSELRSTAFGDIHE